MHTEEPDMTDSRSVREQQSIFGLKEIRESRGISFQKIIEATRVSPQMIQALEGYDFSKLPEPVYTKAFLRSYARVLDIDSAPLIERYETYCSGIQPPGNRYDDLKKRRRKRSALPRVALAVIVVGIVSLAVYYYWGSQSPWYPVKRAPMTETKEVPVPADEARNATEERTAGTPEHLPPSTETGTDEPVEPLSQVEPKEDARHEEGLRTSPPTGVTAAPAIPTAGADEMTDGMVLEIRATALTWLRIKRDDEPPRAAVPAGRQPDYAKGGEPFRYYRWECRRGGGFFPGGLPRQAWKNRGSGVHESSRG